MRKNKMTALLSLACAATLAASVGVVVMNNMPVANAETTHTEAIFMANGASIRYSAPSGIRFIGYVDEDVYTEDSVVGMKITVGGVEKDFSTATLAGAEWQWAESDVAGYKKFQVAITEIPAAAYETEMTAQAYVDSEKSAEIVTRSIANVAVAALAADTLEDKLLDTNVTKLEGYVNDAAVALPFDATTVSVESGNIVFDAVENAKGYLVQMGSKMTNIPATDATTYSVSLGGFEGDIKMLPYGDGVEYRYAATAFSTTYAPTIVNFNSSECTAMVQNGNPNTTVTTNVYSAFDVNEVDTTKGNGGALHLKVRGDQQNWNPSPYRAHIVTVNLPKPLDLTNNEAISIDFCVSDWSGTGTTELRFLVLHATTIGNDYKRGNSTAGYVEVVKDSSVSNFQTFAITAEQLKKIGYKDGSTYLALSVWTNGDTNPGQGGRVHLWLDDISYCSAKEATTAQLKNGQLANFNSSVYTTTVVPGNEHATNGGGTKLYGAFALNEVDTSKGDGGALHLKVRGDTSSWRSAGYSHIVTVNLLKPLDLTNNAAVAIDFCVSGWSGSDTTEVRFMVLHATLIDKDYRAGEGKAGYVEVVADANVANFQTLTITSEQLKSIGYKDGSTYLTLSVWTNGNTNPGTGGTVHLWLDNIKYVSASELLAPTIQEGELATFNDALYASTLKVVPGITAKYSTFRTGPSYADGVVSFSAFIDEHRTTTNGAIYNNFIVFSVSLPKALDMDNGYDGIKIRAYAGYSHCGASDTVKLELFAKGKNTTWRAGTASVQSEAVAQESWIEFTITNEQLATLGYKTGDSELIIGFRTTTMANGGGNYMYGKLDYINYYKAES